MKAFVVGGAGTYGRLTAEILARSDIVSQIVIAGRDLEAAERAAAELGGKATAVKVDIFEEGQLASLAGDSDIMINTAGPEYKVVIPALREAIKAGVNYCDLCCYAPTTEQALELHDEAKAAGITALIGIGLVGLSNLMMVHAAHRLDRAEEIRLCFFNSVPIWGYDAEECLAAWRKAGRVEASGQIMLAQVAGKIRVYRNGDWLDVDPLEDGVRVSLPGGDEVTAYPVGLCEPITVPRAVPDAGSVSTVQSFFPPEVAQALYGFGRRVASGELDESQAAISFFEYEAALPEASGPPPKGSKEGIWMWVEATGLKQGELVRYKCWPIGDWATTRGPLAAAVLKILRGEIRTRGVLTPEFCLDPMPFFAEVAQLENAQDSERELIAESFEGLE